MKEDPEQITKEIRVMNQFFDYESWNDRMNKLDPSKRKGRPNPKLKKRKRINW